MSFRSIKRLKSAVVAIAGAAMLTGCFMVPGKFDSEMELSADGSFTYSYDGEIYLLGLTQLAEMSGEFDDASDASDGPCYDYNDYTDDGDEISDPADEAGSEVEAAADEIETAETTVQSALYRNEPVERECTAEELAERLDAEASRVARRQTEMEQMSALFGGVNPSDPDAGSEIAERLKRQYGWEQVDYIGGGKFDVEFRIASRMTHDFAFPMIEGMTSAQPFVHAYRRNGAVRIDAPGFAPGPGQSGAGIGGGNLGLLGLMMGMDGGSEEAEVLEMLKLMDGSFTLITDGEVLANNTDDGFERLPDGRRRMNWTIDASTEVAPMALIGM